MRAPRYWSLSQTVFLARYGRVTPFCQAYADLFSLPGWQAARFVGELDIQKVAASDEPLLLV